MVAKQSKGLLVFVVILFIASVLPGQGTKAANQQAIMATEYTCQKTADCPVCVGAGLAEPGQEGFLQELSYSQCVQGKCQLSDACLIWDCGKSGNCNSIKQTLFDNTFVKLRDNSFILIVIILGLVGY